MSAVPPLELEYALVISHPRLRRKLHRAAWDPRSLHQKNLHAILLEELEAESEHWINTPEDITAKITDDLWEVPGNNTAKGQISMPDEHLWRFSADVGLYNQEEEVGALLPLLAQTAPQFRILFTCFVTPLVLHQPWSTDRDMSPSGRTIRSCGGCIFSSSSFRVSL